MALGSTQPLTEISTRNLPGGKGEPVHGADNLTTIFELEDQGLHFVGPYPLTCLAWMILPGAYTPACIALWVIMAPKPPLHDTFASTRILGLTASLKFVLHFYGTA
jgi:hypothetical protein